jgi:hypothetical protein
MLLKNVIFNAALKPFRLDIQAFFLPKKIYKFHGVGVLGQNPLPLKDSS